MGAFLPLLGGLVGSQLGGPTVTGWLGGPSEILGKPSPVLAPPSLPGGGVSIAKEGGGSPLGPEGFSILAPEERADLRLLNSPLGEFTEKEGQWGLDKPDMRDLLSLGNLPEAGLKPEGFSLFAPDERGDLTLPGLNTTNPTGTTLGISNEMLGPLLAGLAGSMALGALPMGSMGGGDGEVPPLPPPQRLQQQAFGRIASQQAPQPQYQAIGLPKGYVGKTVGSNLTAEELIRLLRSARV